MFVAQVKGAAAAGAAGFLIPANVSAVAEHPGAPQAPHQQRHIVAGKNAVAPTLRNLRVFRFQSLAQRAANLINQEPKCHMADPFPVFQSIGHYHHIHHPAAVQPVLRAWRQFQLHQGLGQCRLQRGGRRRLVPFVRHIVLGKERGFLSRGRFPFRHRRHFLLGGHRLDRAVAGLVFLRHCLVGHQHPIDQAVSYQLDVAGVGDMEHQFLEPGKAEFFLVEAGDAAHHPLFQGSQQRHPPGLPLGADNILDDPDDFSQLLLAAGGGPGGTGRRRRGRRGPGFRLHIGIVKNQPIHLVSQAAGSAPGNADDDYVLANGAQGVDDMDEVGIAGHQHIGADVGVRVGALDTVGGHLDIHAVFHPEGAGVAGQAADRQPRRDIHRLDAGGVEGRRVIDELTGPAQLRRPGYPVGISLGHYHPAVMGNFLFEGGNIGVAIAGGQANLEVFPVDKEGDVVAVLRGTVCGYDNIPSPADVRMGLAVTGLKVYPGNPI